jgi:hypothetical protein
MPMDLSACQDYIPLRGEGHETFYLVYSGDIPDFGRLRLRDQSCLPAHYVSSADGLKNPLNIVLGRRSTAAMEQI